MVGADIHLFYDTPNNKIISCVDILMPLVSTRGRGQIRIGERVTINSTPRSNALNVTGSTSLFAGPEGELLIDDGAGISGAQLIQFGIACCICGYVYLL